MIDDAYLARWLHHRHSLVGIGGMEGKRMKPLTERVIVATCVVVCVYLLWMLANLTAVPLVAGQMVVNNLNGQLQQCQQANQQLQGALREKPAEKK